LSEYLRACRIAHDRPSLAVESGHIPSNRAEKGLSFTSRIEKTGYGSVSAIRLLLRLSSTAEEYSAMGVSRVRFPARQMMLAVALLVLVADGTVLARRRGVYRGRAGFSAHQEQVAARQFSRSENAPWPATRSPSVELKENARFVRP